MAKVITSLFYSQTLLLALCFLFQRRGDISFSPRLFFSSRTFPLTKISSEPQKAFSVVVVVVIMTLFAGFTDKTIILTGINTSIGQVILATSSFNFVQVLCERQLVLRDSGCDFGPRKRLSLLYFDVLVMLSSIIERKDS